jgi:ribosomal protein S18 acetylase RimI-like enzyme
MKEKIDIRKAVVADLDDVLRLNFDLFKKEYREYDKTLNLKWTFSQKSKNYFKRRITHHDGFLFVAEENKKIVGYLCGGFHKQSYRIEGKYAELENMIIRKRWRGKGVGFMLAKEFFQWCEVNKVDHISVTASAHNKEGIKFYRSLGFKDYNLTLEMKGSFSR